MTEEELSQYLEQNKDTKSLNLARKRMKVNQIKMIANFLKYNFNITALNLEGCNIGDEGVMELTEALSYHKTLTYLNLNWNSIEKEGAKKLADVIKFHQVLKTVDLGSNLLGEGGEVLANALEHNKVITKFYVSANMTTERLVTTIKTVVKRNKLEKFTKYLNDNKNKEIKLNLGDLVYLKSQQDEGLLTLKFNSQNLALIQEYLEPSYYQEKLFTFLRVCKVLQPEAKSASGSLHISDLPKAILNHIASFIDPFEAYNDMVEASGKIEEEHTNHA